MTEAANGPPALPDCRPRDHFIPLRTAELIQALCAGKETPAAQREDFRQFCHRVAGVLHGEYSRLLDRLKAAYAPFDPDADTCALARTSEDARTALLNELFLEFTRLMEGADFRHLSREDIEPVLRGASDWGLDVKADFRLFKRLAIFARGDTTQSRRRRRRWKRWRYEEVEVPVYRRLVMIMKLRRDARLPPQVDPEKVYLQLFKDIPKQDIKMLLPGVRVRISHVDRSKIGFSLLSGLALTLWRVAREVAEDFWHIVLNLDHPAAWWGLATGTLGYGARSYLGYRQTRQRYHLSLTQILYFQNLDTNAGVLFRLLDEAEEQDCRETILAYHALWQGAGEAGWTAAELNRHVELDVWRRVGLRVSFGGNGVLSSLRRLQLVEAAGDHVRARPLDDALRTLDAAWARLASYNSPRL